MIKLRFRLLMAGFSGLLVLAGSLPAGAWGANGHRVVGQVAQNHLSEKTLRVIDGLLEGDSLARISTWPDFVRSDPAFDFASVWHYISLEADEDLTEVDASESDTDEIEVYEPEADDELFAEADEDVIVLTDPEAGDLIDGMDPAETDPHLANTEPAEGALFDEPGHDLSTLVGSKDEDEKA